MSNDTPKQPPEEVVAGQKKTGQEIHRADLHASPVHAELVEAILSRLEIFFSSKMAELFVTADEELFQSANQAKNTAEQNRLFELMNALRKQREIIGKIFFTELNKFLRPVAICKELPKKRHHAPTGGLSLIDQDQMDEMVALTTISGKAAVDYREELAHLDARLEHLALLNRNIFHPKALDPQHICAAFQESLFTSGFDKHNKLLLYKMFGSEVIKNLKTLYDDLNGLMIRAGILPQIEHTGRVRRDPRDNRQRAMHQAPPVEEHFTDAQVQGPLGRGGQSGGYYASPAAGGGGSGAAGGYAGTSAGHGHAGMAGGGAAGHAGMAGGGPGGSSGGSAGGGSGGGSAGHATGQHGMAGAGSAAAAGHAVGHSAGGGHPASQGGAGGHSGSTQGGGQSVAAGSGTSGGDQRISAGLPVGHIRQSISGFVGGDPVTADTSGGDGGVDGAVYYTRQEVVTALSGMQNVVEVSPHAPLQFDASSIKKAVLASIGERSGGIVNKRVNQISEKTIDFIKLIFDAIIEDRGINDTIKALLLSLQIPIIKAAMLDADFFIDDQHPARQLLDRIAEAGVGVSDHKDVVYIELNAIVKTLLKDYNEDIGAFSVALDAIKALTDRIYEQARNTEKQSQEQVKHAHARNVVLQEIRKITLGKELAPGIRILVLKIWPSLMFNHYLRFGKANDEWVEMLMILSKIIESVQSHYSIADFEELGMSHEDLILSVLDKLKKCRKPAAVLDQAVNELRDTYQQLDEQRAAMAAKTAQEAAVSVVPQATTVVAATDEAEPPVAEKPVEVITAAPTANEMPQVTQTEARVETESEAGTPAEMADEADAGEEAEAEAEIKPEQAARAKLQKLPAEVQPGAWFIVYNGENRPVRRLKLAVILMQDATMVFVDHLGNVVIEKDAEEFAAELERGASGVIMQHSVFDHALRSALTSIQR